MFYKQPSTFILTENISTQPKLSFDSHIDREHDIQLKEHDLLWRWCEKSTLHPENLWPIKTQTRDFIFGLTSAPM